MLRVRFKLPKGDEEKKWIKGGKFVLPIIYTFILISTLLPKSLEANGWGRNIFHPRDILLLLSSFMWFFNWKKRKERRRRKIGVERKQEFPFFLALDKKTWKSWNLPLFNKREILFFWFLEKFSQLHWTGFLHCPEEGDYDEQEKLSRVLFLLTHIFCV